MTRLSLPSAISVPAPVGVKKPPMPAPAARIRSEKVPCGTSSTSISFCKELPLEFLVLADVGRDHLADLPRAQQRADAVIVDAGVVADDGEVLGAAAMQRGDQVFGNAAEPEAAHHDGGAIGNDGDRLVGGGQHFVHDVNYRQEALARAGFVEQLADRFGIVEPIGERRTARRRGT